MRDAEGRAINHPAAMVYDDIASQINEDAFNPYDRPPATDPIIDEAASDEMSQLQNPSRAKSFMRYAKDKRRGKYIGRDSRNRPKLSPKELEELHLARVKDDRDKNYAQKVRQIARDRTSQMMDEPDQAAGPNFGMQQSTGTDVKMKEGNIMDQM